MYQQEKLEIKSESQGQVLQINIQDQLKELEDKKNQIARYEQLFESQNQEIQQYKNRAQNLEFEKQEIIKQNKSLQEEVNQLKDNQYTSSQIQQYQILLQQEQLKSKNLQEKNSIAESQLAMLQQQYEYQKKQLESESSAKSNQEKVQELENQLLQQQNEKIQLMVTIQQLQEQGKKDQQQIQMLDFQNQENQNLQFKVRDLEAEKASLIQKQQLMSDQLQQYENMIKQQQDQAQQAISQSQQQIFLKKQEEQKNQSLQEKNAYLEEETKVLKKQSDENKQLIKQIEHFTKENKNLEATQQTLENQVKELHKQLQIYQGQIVQHSEEIQVIKQIYSRRTLVNLQKEFQKKTHQWKFIKQLFNRYNAYRQVRADGNSYFRAIGFAYLEHLCRFTTPDDNLRDFIHKVKSQTMYYQLRPNENDEDAQRLRQTFLSLLYNLQERKIQKDKFIIQYLEEQIQYNSNNQDEALVWEMRCLTANYLEAHREYYESYCQQKQFQKVIENVLTMGKEADSLTIVPLQIVLKLKIQIETSEEQSQIKSILDVVVSQGICPLIYLVC